MNAAPVQTGCAIPAEDLRMLHERLPLAETLRVKMLASVLVRFDEARDKGAFVSSLRGDPRFAPIASCLSVPSLYRKLQAWRETRSLLCLADRRKFRTANTQGLESNAEFVEYWHALCLTNKRKVAPARRELFARLASGEEIPGYGDWRALFAGENGGTMPAPDMACPYRPGILEPRGWSLRNLTKLKPGVFALAAARKGMMEAQMTSAPTVVRTRVGLAPCQVVQIDDMWYEHKVAFAGNRHAQRVVEFAAVDVLTGHVICHLAKPVREREDGTRETLRGIWTNYLLAYILCEVGIPEAGCLVMGEHGTASADGELMETLASVSGGRVRFGAGGLLDVPMAKGLHEGRPKGNPRYKGLIEGFHALVKNELGGVRGHVGGGRGSEPGTVYGMDKQDEQLRAVMFALERSRPGISERLQLPYMPYADFMAVVDAAYERIDRSVEHALGDWEACGFIQAEYRPTPTSPWTAWQLGALPPAQEKAFKYLIETGDIPYRTRRMSRGEAWRSRQGELRKLDAFVAPLVMGAKLARLCTVDDRLQMAYRDETTLRRCTVAGIVDGGGSLERGRTYRVWINPLAPLKAYVSDADGRFIGTAPVMEAARYDDQAAIQRQLGIRQAAIAEERRRLQPFINRQVREAAAVAARNAREILGEDPAEEAALLEAASVQAARVRAYDAPSASDLLGAPQPSGGEDIRDEDLF